MIARLEILFLAGAGFLVFHYNDPAWLWFPLFLLALVMSLCFRRSLRKLSALNPERGSEKSKLHTRRQEYQLKLSICYLAMGIIVLYGILA